MHFLTGSTRSMRALMNMLLVLPGAWLTPAYGLTLTANSWVNVSCFGADNGAASVYPASGGTPPYSYSWSHSGSANSVWATGLSAGDHTVTVTDSLGATATRLFTLIQPPALSATSSVTNVAMHGAANGAARIFVGGGEGSYRYAWSPSGGSASSATGLSAGNYTVTVTDDNGCTLTHGVTIVQPQVLTASISATQVTTVGGSDGSATVTASGGWAPYTYLWSPTGGSAATATGLAAGTYSVTVTDQASVETVQSVAIAGPDVAAPSYQSAVLSVDLTGITLTFNEALLNNLPDLAALKAAITFAADGTNFAALAAGDTVAIAGSTLTVTFAAPLAGTRNKLKLVANSLKDTSGNVLASTVTTAALYASVDPAIISTVAGSGARGFGGDGLSATDAAVKLDSPAGVVVDSAGNIYIADRDNHRIRKVTAATGLISTLVGDGIAGFSGDGGSAATARVNFPGALAVDGANNLYIADVNNHRIRKVDASGNISTVVGNGYSGNSGDGGPATAASLSYPDGIAVDGIGNLYFVSGNSALRKVDTGGNISTVASGFTAALGLAVDGAGNAYVADYYGPNFSGAQIFKVAAGSSTFTTFAGGGSGGDGGAATAASVSQVRSVAIDSRGNVYFGNGQSIRKVDGNGIISTIAGDAHTQGFSGDGGAATAARFTNPYALAVDRDDNLYIADLSNDRIRRIVAPPTTPSVTATPGNGQATLAFTTPAPRPATLNPYAVVVTPNGGSAITLNVGANDADTATSGGLTAAVGISDTTTRIVITGLTNGTAYSFAVVASNSVGSTDASSSQSVTPGVPDVPSVSATEGAAQVSLDFATPASNGAALTGYEVVVTPGGGSATSLNVGPNDTDTASSGGLTASVSVSGGNTRIVVSGLTNGTAYAFTVVAGNSAGSSSPSASLSATPAAIPPAPSVTVGAGNQQVLLDFTTPTNLGAARGYTLTVTPGGASAVTLNVGVDAAATATAGGYTATVSVSGAATRIVVSGLANGTAYAFTVAARNSAGSSSPSASQNATPAPTVPDAPHVSAYLSGRDVTLEFPAPAHNGAALTGYTVVVTPGGGSAVTIDVGAATGDSATAGGFTASVAVGSNVSITISGLTYGTTYGFTVAARNSAGSSTASTSQSATPVGAPAAPVPSPSVGNAQVTLTFATPASNGAALTDYTLDMTPGGATTTTLNFAANDGATATDGPFTATLGIVGGTTRIVITGLTNGTAYVFTVTAINSVGSTASAASSPVTPSVPAPDPGPPAPPTIDPVPPVPVPTPTAVSVTSPGQSVTAVPGLPVRIAAGANVEGATIDFPANAPITVELGGSRFTVSAQTNGTQLALTRVVVNGQPVLALVLRTGSARIVAGGVGETLLVLGDGTTPVVAGTANATVDVMREGTSTVLSVGSGFVVLSPGTQRAQTRALSTANAASAEYRVYVGERATLDAAGRVSAHVLGGGNVNSAGDALSLSWPSNLSLVSSVPQLDAQSERLGKSVLQAIADTVGVAEMARQSQGVLVLYDQGHNLRLLPLGEVNIDPTLADGVALGADGMATVTVRGVQVRLAPSVSDLGGLARDVAAVLPGATLKIGTTGVIVLTTAEGAPYALRPDWFSQTAMTQPLGFAVAADGRLEYVKNFRAFTLYPAFSDFAALTAAVQGSLPGATLKTNPDGTVTVASGAQRWTLTPHMQLNAAPEETRQWWVEADGSLRLRNADGTLQRMTAD